MQTFYLKSLAKQENGLPKMTGVLLLHPDAKAAGVKCNADLYAVVRNRGQAVLLHLNGAMEVVEASDFESLWEGD